MWYLILFWLAAVITDFDNSFIIFWFQKTVKYGIQKELQVVEWR